jgi:hypothetical protein
MEIRSTYIGVSVAFTREELRIIGLALVRGLKDKDDIKAALLLNERLLEGRRRIVQEELHLVEGALEKVRQEVGPDTPPARNSGP